MAGASYEQGNILRCSLRLWGRREAHEPAAVIDQPQIAAVEKDEMAAADLIEATGYKRRLGELAGAIPASVLAADRNERGRPIWEGLVAG